MDLDISTYLRFVIALVFVLALIGFLVTLARKFNIGYGMPGLKGQKGRTRERRLSIVEVMPVDSKRRLVLVRRDDREHLILLGPATELVVEDGIDAMAGKAGKDSGYKGSESPVLVLQNKKTSADVKDAT